jgi:hypothetical protein
LSERLGFNRLFRWFVGRAIDGVVWGTCVFCKNRGTYLEAGNGATAVRGGTTRGVASPSQPGSLSRDGTVIDVRASIRSFRPKARARVIACPGRGHDADRVLRGEKRSNATCAGPTDPEARL